MRYLQYGLQLYKRLTLESLFTNLEQTSLNRCQQLPCTYRLQTTCQQNRQIIIVVVDYTDTSRKWIYVLPVRENEYRGNKHKSEYGATGNDDICRAVLCKMK